MDDLCHHQGYQLRHCHHRHQGRGQQKEQRLYQVNRHRLRHHHQNRDRPE
jgi:hypothetical protein